MARRGRGRPPGETGHRDAILAEARRQFGELGYRRATLRGIARGAGVDPRLLIHYFGSKQNLFRETIELPIAPERVIDVVFGGGGDNVGRRAAELMVSVVADESSRRALAAMLRAAVSEPEAAELIRQRLTDRVLGPIAGHVEGARPELRASLVASQLVGLLVVGTIVGIEPLASASPEELTAALAPVIEHLLEGDWI